MVEECSRLKRADLSTNFDILLPPTSRDGRLEAMPLGPNLVKYLRALPETSRPDASIFQKCSSIRLAELERQFRRLQERALGRDPRMRFHFSDLWFDLSRLPKPGFRPGCR